MKSIDSVNSHTTSRKKIATRDIVLIGMFAAVLAIISQISLPMPSGVPITIQMFGVALVGAVLGSRIGCMTTLVYILIGAIGLPVFANFTGGMGVLAGPTGGYIFGWPFMAFLCGIRPKTSNPKTALFLSILFSLLGLFISEIWGSLQWAALSGDMGLGAILAYSFIAFIPKDIVITILAIIIGKQMRLTLIRTGLLSD